MRTLPSLRRILGAALTLGLLGCLPQTSQAQITGTYTYDSSAHAYFVTDYASVWGNMFDNEVFVGKDNATSFKTIATGNLKVTAGAQIQQYNNHVYPDGKFYRGLNIFGGNQANVSIGGHVNNVNCYDTSLLGIGGGSVGNVIAYDSSVINVRFGDVSQVTGTLTSTVNFRGGSVDDVIAYNSGVMNISGGSVFSATASEGSSSVLNISGGNVNGIYGDGDSVFHLTGGKIGDKGIHLLNDSILTVTGTELALSSGVPGSDGAGSYTAYTLSGVLQGGQSVNGVTILDYDGGLSIGDPYSGTGSLRFLSGAAPSAAPEPASLAFVVVGGLALAYRRRRAG